MHGPTAVSLNKPRCQARWLDGKPRWLDADGSWSQPQWLYGRFDGGFDGGLDGGLDDASMAPRWLDARAQ
jgi:hypothetical protein